MTIHFYINIKGLPKEAAYNALPFGRQIEHRHAIEAFKASAAKVWVSSKRKSYASAMREFRKLHRPVQWFARVAGDANYHDDSFEVWYVDADALPAHVDLIELVGGTWGITIDGIQWGPNRDASGAGDAEFETRAEARAVAVTL